MRYAVVGTRQFPEDMKYLILDFVNSLPEDSVIVSGGAKGVDTWSVEAAKNRGLKYKEYLPQRYDENGKYRGHFVFFDRNTDIINDADFVAAFWDGSSTGTFDSIDKAKKKGLPVKIFYPDGRTEFFDGNSDNEIKNNLPRPDFGNLPEACYLPLSRWIKKKRKNLINEPF